MRAELHLATPPDPSKQSASTAEENASALDPEGSTDESADAETPLSTAAVGLGGGAVVRRLQRYPQRVGRFSVPLRYELWRDGLYVLRPDADIDPSVVADLGDVPDQGRREQLFRLAHSPVWIAQFGRAPFDIEAATPDSSELLIELAFLDPVSGQPQTLWVDRSQITSRTQISKLARWGLPVVESSSDDLMAYLNAAVYLNGSRLPCTVLSPRCGYVSYQTGDGAQHGWLAGTEWVGAPLQLSPLPASDGHSGTDPLVARTLRPWQPVQLDPRVPRQEVGGYTVSGSASTWLELVARLTGQAVTARWLVFSSFAAPLLRIVGCKTFVIYHCGKRDSGKTSIAKLAMSAFGDPHRLFDHLNRGPASITEMFGYVNDLPVHLDELDEGAKKRELETLLRNLTLEKGRKRAGATGGLLSYVDSWRTIVRMTGSVPLLGKHSLLGDTSLAPRIVQISEAVLTSETALEVHRWLEQGACHGGAGRVFLAKLAELLNTPTGLAQVRAIHQSHVAYIQNAVQGTVAASRVEQLAVVGTATYYAFQWFYGFDIEAAARISIGDALQIAEMLKREERSDAADTALQYFVDHFYSHRSQWLDCADPIERTALTTGKHTRLVGVLPWDADEVWLIQKEANKLLAEAGIQRGDVWPQLEARGILKVTAGGTRTMRNRGAFNLSVYTLVRPKTPWRLPEAPAMSSIQPILDAAERFRTP